MVRFYSAVTLCLFLMAAPTQAAPLAPLVRAPQGIIAVHDISRYGTFCQMEACPFGPMTAEQAAEEEKATSRSQAVARQLGGLGAAFILFCLSGLKGLNALRWRRQGQRVEGKIFGILDMPRFRILKSSSPLKFTPVLKFSLGGEMHEARLDRSFLKEEDVATGKIIPLLVLPSDMTVARSAEGKVFDVLDICMVLFAAILFIASVSQPPLTLPAAAMAVAICGFVLWHSARIWIPAKSPAVPRKLALGAAYGIRPVEDILKERGEKLRKSK